MTQEVVVKAPELPDGAALDNLAEPEEQEQQPDTRLMRHTSVVRVEAFALP